MRQKHKPARLRLGAVLLVAFVFLSACGVGDDAPPTEPGAASTGDPAEDGPSALADMTNSAFPEPLIDPNQVRSGGPPPDGIPPIDDPVFGSVDEVDWLSAEEPVIALTINNDTRAYPVQIMTWHEIVNDTVGAVPVSVTYCPLCNSGAAFERNIDGRLLTFGTSGRLYQDNLVMYDRQTESLWPQFTGVASIGVLTGTELTKVPMRTITWSEFREAYPDAQVLQRPAESDRPYGQNPYVGYDDPEGAPIFGSAEATNPKLPPQTRVVGVDLGGEQIAIERNKIAKEGVVQFDIRGESVIVMHQPGQVSALDTGTIRDGKDIGTVTVYRAVVEGKAVSFARSGTNSSITDDLGNTWDILGRAVDGPDQGAQLEPVDHFDTFWFSWVAFHAATRLE